MDSNEALLSKFSLGGFSLDRHADPKESFASSSDDL